MEYNMILAPRFELLISISTASKSLPDLHELIARQGLGEINSEIATGQIGGKALRGKGNLVLSEDF